MDLLGTIFSGGLIHIWGSSEYLQHRNNISGIDSKLSIVSMFVLRKPSHSTQLNMFLIILFVCFFNKNMSNVLSFNGIY